ncbi:DUF5961 family protein [Caulobacter sp. NIBR2454]|uniref:DUF5961 family protein n=1 Tax=Caulobacter sp. NIBR2454 TaxID=3015996 RepID=UPI0022B70C61|nr:DUF5961 family protein [Caulobacter sp. NIBR2454]
MSPKQTASQQRYFVRLAGAGHERGQTVIAESVEEAAVAFLELGPDGQDQDEVRIIVRPCDEGRDHCLTIDLMSGEARACD